MFDIDYPNALLIALLLIVNIALVSAVATSDSPYGPYNSDWDGAADLRTTAADETDLTVSQSSTVYQTEPTGVVAFIVGPQEEYGPVAEARVDQFVQRGGTLVVASDANQTNQLLENVDAEVRINGTQLRDERESFRDPGLPVATNVADHPLTESVPNVTLNRGTVLSIPSTNVTGVDESWNGTSIINSSSFAYLDENGNEELDDREQLNAYPIATVEPIGEGQVVVVSDASVFTNSMLERDGNRQFVRSLAGAHDHVIIDYSLGSPLPPLVQALLVIRSTPLLQVALGLAAVLGVSVLLLGEPSLPHSVFFRTNVDRENEDPLPLDEAEVAEFLTVRHPEWDTKRIDRVTKAIIRRRRQTEDND